MSTVIWGGEYFGKILALFLDDVIAFVDNNEKLRGTRIFDKYEVYSPTELKNMSFDAIVISSFSDKVEIKRQIEELGYGDKVLEIPWIGMEDTQKNNMRISDSWSSTGVFCEGPLILRGVTITNCTSIGGYTYINRNTRMRLVTRIGRYCTIAENVVLWNANHMIEGISAHPIFCAPDLSYCEGFYDGIDIEQYKEWYQMINAKRKAITRKKNTLIIGNDVWIGNGAKVLEGVEVGDGAIIGAGAIVTKDVPPYAIVGGNPAKVIKFRFEDDIIDRLLRIKWWNYGPEILMGLDIINPSHEVLDELEERVNSGRYARLSGNKFLVKKLSK